MHNCKAIRNSLTDLALNEIQPGQQKQLLAELNECAACREEYAAIKEALRVSGQALVLSQPAESFWAGYHERLADRLAAPPARVSPVMSSGTSQLWLRLKSFATASVRVPVPVAAAVLLLLFGGGVLAALNSRRPANSGSTPPMEAASTVITRTVTVPVPVPQEKIITRVVYVDRNRTRSRNNRGELNGSVPRNNLAQSEVETPDTTAISLIGFKPPDQVKLKIMKGSYRDER